MPLRFVLGTSLGTTQRSTQDEHHSYEPLGLELHGSSWRATKHVPADLFHCYPLVMQFLRR